MGFTKLQQVALTWLLALGLSALLVAAGQHWPQPLPIRAGWVWAALFGLPLLTLVAVLARWSLPQAPPPRERHHGEEPCQRMPLMQTPSADLIRAERDER